MPDFAMCMGEEQLADGTINSCPLKDTCYRYIADPDPEPSQTFLASIPYEKDSCNYYWQTYCSDEDSEVESA